MHGTLSWAVVLVVGAANLGLIALSMRVDPRTGSWRRESWRELCRNAWQPASQAFFRTLRQALRQALRQTLGQTLRQAIRKPRSLRFTRAIPEAVFVFYALSWLTLLA